MIARGLVRVVALLTALAACVLPAAAATRFAIVVDPTMALATLSDHGLVLDRTAWTSPDVTVLVASRATPPTTNEAFDLVDTLVASRGVYGAGVVMDDRRDHITFFAGRALVQFSVRTDFAIARSWAASHGFTVIEYVGEENTYLVRAPLDKRDLIAHELRPDSLGPVAAFSPVFHDVYAPGSKPQIPGGEYHHYPAAMNLLAVELIPGVAPPASFNLNVHGGSVVESARGTIEILAYRGESDMMKAQQEFLTQSNVKRVGPVVSRRPLIFMTNQLIVQYRSTQARFQAEVTRATFKLREQRSLPYADHTFLLAYPVASYALYDVAEQLVQSRLASFAVPNLFRISPDSCGDTSACGDSHHTYLQLMDVCDTWDELLAPSESVVLGILDQGISRNVTSVDVCSELRVGAAIDFGTMETCQPADRNLCSSACDATASNWKDPHGHQMALTAAASHDSGDLLGVAPEATIVIARRSLSYANELMTEVALADALWWMAGGDPEWCRDGTNYCCECDVENSTLDGCTNPALCTSGGLPAHDLPSQLPEWLAADVINMSFHWPDVENDDCLSAPGVICAKVCAPPVSTCNIVNAVLDRLYEPELDDDVDHGIRGTLPITSAGLETTQSPEYTDHWLKDLGSTVAVGAVTTSGEATTNDGKEINTRGSFMDVVAPMGGDNATRLCASCSVETGRSSAASAATSGVAVLMLRQNPKLTPPQMHCILRETADDSPDGLWSSSDPAPGGESACKFAGDQSPCMGHGLVDACEAVEAARDCLCGCCICDEAGDKNDCDGKIGETIFEGEMRLFISAPDDLAIPDFVWKLIECAEVTKDCRCVLNPEDCFRVDVRNSYGYDLFRITAEVCIENRCWELPGRWKEWRTEESIEFPLRVGEEAWRWSRRVDGPLTLRFLSRGVPIGEQGFGSERPK